MSYRLQPATCVSEDNQQHAAQMLSKQWGGSTASRLAMIQQKDFSWILTAPSDTGPVAVGHVRLTPSVSISNDIQGSAPCGVLTSVVVDAEMRGQGIGAIMMQSIEQEAIKLSYYQLYLWTYDAVDFYRKLGYCVSEQRRAMSTMSTTLESITPAKMNSLESLLARKLEVVQSTAARPAVMDYIEYESATQLPGTASAKGDAIWMRKRICDEVPLERVPVSTILASIHRTLAASKHIMRYDIYLHACVPECCGLERHAVLHYPVNCNAHRTNASESDSDGGAPVLQSGDSVSLEDTTAHAYLPWSHQVGPSCGIQALRFAEHMLCSDNTHVNSDRAELLRKGTGTSECSSVAAVLHSTDNNNTGKTLLQRAIELGYTVEGDIYNIHHMCAMAQLLGVATAARNTHSAATATVEASVQSTDQLSCADVCSMLLGTPAPASATTPLHSDDHTAADAVDTEGSGHSSPALLIFPYDRDDAQSTPCCKEGVAAHYALICGFILLPDADCGVSDARACEQDCASSLAASTHDAQEQSNWTSDSLSVEVRTNIHPIITRPSVSEAPLRDSPRAPGDNPRVPTVMCPRFAPRVPSTIDSARVLLVGIHGLSSKPIVAPYDDWMASNAQLHCATAKLSPGTECASLKGNIVIVRLR